MFTPRHLRKKFRRSGGPPDIEKKRAFRRAKGYSNLFIHQSDSFLSRTSVIKNYTKYKEKVGDGSKGLRMGGKS